VLNPDVPPETRESWYKSTVRPEPEARPSEDSMCDEKECWTIDRSEEVSAAERKRLTQEQETPEMIVAEISATDMGENSAPTN